MSHRLFLVAVVPMLLLGCDPPSGPDLATITCVCDDEASGSSIFIDGRVCTDLSDPDKAMEDAQSQCDAKETTCIPSCPYPISNCGVAQGPTLAGMCPNNSSPLAGGDFGQTTSVAVSATLSVFGDDVDDFETTFDNLFVATTLSDGMLQFADIAGSVSEVNFSTPGGFLGIGGGSHTITDAQLFLTSPFSVPLNDGFFEIGHGVADFIVSARLDGEFAPLAATSHALEGVYVEELGFFNLYGQIDPAGADVHISVNIVFEFLNRPPRARAGSDQTVECSSVDQTGAVNLSASESFDLDGADDIARYTWTADFGSTNAQSALGRDVSMTLALGAHSIELAVADQLGSFGEDAVTVTVSDTTAPSISVLEPAAIAYPHSVILTLDYAVNDTCTGVAQQIAKINGATTLAGHGLDDGQVIDLLTELPLGTHTFTLEAADAVGNEDSASVQFTIVVTPESLIHAIERFAAGGDITDPGLADALLGQARVAAALHNAGSCSQAQRVYLALFRTVQRNSGRRIDPVAAGILIADVEYLIAHCP